MRTVIFESRDSNTLKPAELDVLGQVLCAAGIGIPDSELERQVEMFPLVVFATKDEEVQAFLFGSLERVGGTPCVLWGLAAARPSRQTGPSLKGLIVELYRRAAISFPDEDVVVGGRFAHPAGYQLLSPLREVVPRPGYKATGEERAWGRRLAKRFGCDSRFDDKTFIVSCNGSPEPRFDPGASKTTPKPDVVELMAKVNPSRGDAMVAFGWAMTEALTGKLAKS